MRTDKYSCGSLGIVAGYDVCGVQYGAVKAFEVCFLCLYVQSVRLELLHDPLAALVVCR